MNVKRLLTALLVLAFVATLAPAATAQEPATFKGAYPYQVPPVGHLNSFVTNGIPNGIGIYHDLLETSPAIYLWATGEWHPLMAESWGVEGDDWVMNLRQGCKWSDGSDFTAADVVTTWSILRLQNHSAFRYVDDVRAIDDHTVAFHMYNPSGVMERFILRQWIRADATYGEWAARAQELFAAGLTRDDKEWTDLNSEFNEFRPETLRTTGPYTLDLADVTDTQLILRKNDLSCFADVVNFDQVILYNGETPTVTPLVLSNEVHYATHGFPPATEAAFKEAGIRILRPPIYSGPALYFNYTIHPFEMVEFRQAIAYAVDRVQNGFISLAESGVAVEYMAGFSDNLVPLWLTEDQMAALDKYEYNLEKAEQMLLDIGFTKGDDGVWLDDQGNRLAFELTVPAEFADWSAAAQNLTDQLNAFGIAVTMRGVQFQQHPEDVNDGNFEMAIRAWGAGNPHPNFSFNQDLNVHNASGLVGRPGMGFSMVQNVKGEEVDLEALWIATAAGTDVAANKAAVAELAAAYNWLLPNIPLWERYGNNPAFPGLTWPPDDDPVYLNSPYADSFVVLMILDGRLAPAD